MIFLSDIYCTYTLHGIHDAVTLNAGDKWPAITTDTAEYLQYVLPLGSTPEEAELVVP